MCKFSRGELWKSKLCKALIWVFSLKNPIAHLSNSFQLIKPVLYEKVDEINFTTKSRDETTLRIKVFSLKNEVIQADTERITPLYKVS